jgi:hypothetical protein
VATGGPLVSPDAMPACAVNEVLSPAGCALVLSGAGREPAEPEPEPASAT